MVSNARFWCSKLSNQTKRSPNFRAFGLWMDRPNQVTNEVEIERSLAIWSGFDD
ncbi:hypothetical protein cgp_1529 [Corynebacterium glutamicum MB001]|uniref:Uncharacterized protein n=1 Tax=Corynebacterium glutamicum (strain ATCC 13032 / DSM 20300 / JCM 1318 / BCRC 11384 / CCUG 27702 / LMG 3730 / NBRC 12168 / NCIMB 10025 / NRRL B-2784 / 534) TaxID=196627 RepID=Q8NQR7_CORGL|nr:hypothetical protein cgp_1529 [Corynebacterium glutamicum MB001]ASW13973.1 hypothetical protein cgc1_1529 [Corynebacterium glutamicum]QYO73566.1 hypothetical protein cgisf_1529 [Corynebacterium glutamicum]BAB98750.1 Hypothetical protein [Corynebacterium glutamicum ATCC 13032]